MATGKVKWFDDTKGFGFIAHAVDNRDVFVHQTVIEGGGYRTLIEGESVEYDVEDGPKGLKATRVKRLDPPPMMPRRPMAAQRDRNRITISPAIAPPTPQPLSPLRSDK